MKHLILLLLSIILTICTCSAQSQGSNYLKNKSFIIGVKGITWKENPQNIAGEYIYNSGQKLKCRVFFNQVGIDFQVENGFGRRLSLQYNFDKIGYNTSNWEVSFPYNDNEYTIGQYDIDGDTIDEIVIAVRTAAHMGYANQGVSINFFDANTLKLKAKVKCSPIGTFDEYQVRFVHNNVYFRSLHWAERFAYIQGSLQSYFKKLEDYDNNIIF